MNYDFYIEKSDNFIGPDGLGSVFQKSIETLGFSGDKSEAFCLVWQESQSFVEKGTVSAEAYFDTNIKKTVLGLIAGNRNSLGDFAKDFIGKNEPGSEEFNICCVVISSGKVFLAAKGSLSAYIFRDGKYAKLSSQNNSVLLSSGEIRKSDVLFISSYEFFKRFSPEKIQNILAKNKQPVANGDVKYFISKYAKYTPFLLIEALGIQEKTKSKLIVNKGDYSGEINRLQNQHLVAEQAYSAISNLTHRIADLFHKNTSYDAQYYELNARKTKTSALVGVLLLIILAVSIGFGVSRKQDKDFRSSYENSLLEATHNYNESMDIYQFNPTRARELFVSSRSTTNQLTRDGIKDAALHELAEQIDQNQGKILGEYEGEAVSFVDLGLLTDGFNGDKIVYSGGAVYVIDRTSKKIVKLSLSTKRSEVLAGPNKIDELFDAASYVDKVFIFNSEGVFEVSGARQKVLDSEFESNILVQAFAGNLYLLNKGNSKILRFAGNGEVFASGNDWLSTSVNLNLSSAKSMVIDGAIWVLMEDGTFNKLVQGNLQNFELKSDFVGSINIENIFVSDELEDFYVLDKSAGKIFVFTKVGEYVAQYVSDEVKNTSAIVVSETEKKIILLNGNKLFSVDLKHQ